MVIGSEEIEFKVYKVENSFKLHNAQLEKIYRHIQNYSWLEDTRLCLDQDEADVFTRNSSIFYNNCINFFETLLNENQNEYDSGIFRLALGIVEFDLSFSYIFTRRRIFKKFRLIRKELKKRFLTIRKNFYANQN